MICILIMHTQCIWKADLDRNLFWFFIFTSIFLTTFFVFFSSTVFRSNKHTDQLKIHNFHNTHDWDAKAPHVTHWYPSSHDTSLGCLFLSLLNKPSHKKIVEVTPFQLNSNLSFKLIDLAQYGNYWFPVHCFSFPCYGTSFLVKTRKKENTDLLQISQKLQRLQSGLNYTPFIFTHHFYSHHTACTTLQCSIVSIISNIALLPFVIWCNAPESPIQTFL